MGVAGNGGDAETLLDGGLTGVQMGFKLGHKEVQVCVYFKLGCHLKCY